MATFVNAWLSSGLLVAGLMLGVLAASRWVRNCHIEYCLWLLLLVKLALPLGVSLFSLAFWNDLGRPFSGELVPGDSLSVPLFIPLAIWIAGSCLFAAGALWRIAGFNKMLRQSLPAPSYVNEMAAALARDLNIRCPEVKFTDADLPPSMWGFSHSPIVILPQALLGQLSPDELRAILAHELTHIRRKDHWIRGYELGVLAIHWWNPVAWLVRIYLRRSEEACCDADVLRQWPSIARAYATALITTVTFSAAPQFYSPTTCANSGDFLSLKRRLEMLLTGAIPAHITIPRSALLILFALLLLPWSLWANTF